MTTDASDNISVNRVEFHVDSILVATDFDSPYSFGWNSLTLSDGAHSIRASAFDDAGNNSSSTATVTVDNICEPGEPFIFAIFADNYSGHESGLRRVFDEFRQKGVRFVVSGGDTSSYERIRSQMDPRLNSMQPCGASEFPWYPGAGNHDVEELEEMSAWAAIWAVDWDNNAANTRLAAQLPGLTNFKRGPLQVGGQVGPVNIQPGTIYSFDYGNAHFLFVNEYEQGIISDLVAGIWDQNGPDVFDPTTSQLDWIKEDLESTDKDARFVLGHVAASTPIYSFTDNPPPGWSEHNKDFVTAGLVQVMTANKVSAYFFGHDHVISRRLVNPDKTVAYDKRYWDIANDPNKPVGDPSAWVDLQGAGRVWQADLGSVSSNSGEYMLAKVDGESVTFETYVYREGDAQSQLWDTWTLPIGPNAPVPDLTVPQIADITSSGLTDKSAAVSWATDELSTSQLEYGLTTAYGQTTTIDSALTLSHSVNLTGLAADTVYHYRLKSADAAGNLGVSPDDTFHTQPTPGQSGSGITTDYLKFEGNDSVRILNSANFPAGPLTVTAWARTSVNGQTLTIVGKGKSGAEQWVMRRVSTNGRIVFGVRGTGSMVNANSPNNQGSDGLWHHYAGVWDGTTVRIYIDGSNANTTSATLTQPMRVDDEPICIGNIAGNTSTCATSGYWNGGIDDMSIWNRALSQAEIQSVMANGLAGSEPGLLWSWNMNEGSGQSLINLANSTLIGVLGTSPIADTNDPIWIKP